MAWEFDNSFLRKACLVANNIDPFVDEWREINRPPPVPEALARAINASDAVDFYDLPQSFERVAKPLKLIGKMVLSLEAGKPPGGSYTEFQDAARAIREATREIQEAALRAELTSANWTADVPASPASIHSEPSRTPRHETAHQAAHSLAERLRELQAIYRDTTAWIRAQTPGFCSKKRGHLALDVNGGLRPRPESNQRH